MERVVGEKAWRRFYEQALQRCKELGLLDQQPHNTRS